MSKDEGVGLDLTLVSPRPLPCVPPLPHGHPSWRGPRPADCRGPAQHLQDEQPPKANNVLVKVLETQGDMVFSFGQATLNRGTLHLLPVEEAEPLVREGVVEVVGGGGR